MPPTTRYGFVCILRIDIHRYKDTKTVRTWASEPCARARASRRREPEPSAAGAGRGVYRIDPVSADTRMKSMNSVRGLERCYS